MIGQSQGSLGWSKIAGPPLSPPAGHRQRPPPHVGTGVRCREPFLPGHGSWLERLLPPSPSRTSHSWESGAKPFVDDLLLGQGFLHSRAAPLLQSIESQLSTQMFVAPSTPFPSSGSASPWVGGGVSSALVSASAGPWVVEGPQYSAEREG